MQYIMHGQFFFVKSHRGYKQNFPYTIGRRFVPGGGLESWNGPDAVAEASQPLPEGIGVRVLDRVGDRVQVECSNGWTTWLDATELDGLP